MLSKERGVRLEERLLRELESTAAVAAAEAPSDSLQGLSLDRQCRRLCCPSCAVPKVRGQVDFDFVTRSRKLRGWFQSRTSPPSVDSLATLLAAPQDPSRSVSLALKALMPQHWSGLCSKTLWWKGEYIPRRRRNAKYLQREIFSANVLGDRVDIRLERGLVCVVMRNSFRRVFAGGGLFLLADAQRHSMTSH